tara:strand:- start:5973 stop:6509 length:537 start_codon:yes stop_codon:yes gene_type:complete
MVTTATNLPVKKAAQTPARGTGLLEHPFESVRREFDRLFEEMDRNSWLAPFSLFNGAPAKTGNGPAWMATPAVDVVERDDAYEITADMPGMDDKNIDVSLANGGLTIHGEKREDSTDESVDHYIRERRYGAFERRFALPEDVNADKIQASYANGVLRVTLPKNPGAASAKRRIDVKKG